MLAEAVVVFIFFAVKEKVLLSKEYSFSFNNYGKNPFIAFNIVTY
jgi:hypothetical protein